MLFTPDCRCVLLVACLVSAALATVTSRAVVKCPASRLADNQDCIPFVVNKAIAGIKFSIYSWSDPTAPTTALADPQYLQPLQDAAEKALPIYAGYTNTKIDSIRVYLTKETDSTLRGETDGQAPDPRICSIKIVGNADGSPNSDTYSVQQALAHELYHCKQKYSVRFGVLLHSFLDRGLQILSDVSELTRALGVQRTFDVTKPVTSNRWWYESSAEYFANVFYPNSQPDHMQYYCPLSPLFAQGSSGGYASSLFFQHLSNTFTPDNAIHNWVVSRISHPSSTLQEEQMKLSSDHFITKAFPSFVTQFIAGAVTYINKVPVVGIRTNCGDDTLIDSVSYSLPAKPGSYQQKLIVLPWQISEQLIITFPAKRMVSFTLTPSGSHTVLQYRAKGQDTWTTAKKGPNIIDSSCHKIEYTFLATSTSNGDTTTPFPVKIQFTVTKPTHNRKVKRDVAYRNTNMRYLGHNSSMTVAQEIPQGDPDKRAEISKRQDGDADTCPISNCPYGSWSFTSDLEINGIKESTPGGTTVSGIDVTGSGTFTLDQDTKSVTLQFDSFSQAFTDTSPSSDGTGDIVIHYNQAIDGGGTATAVFAADGKSFKLANPTYTGKFASETTYNDGDPMGPMGDFAVGFGPDVEVDFACDNVAQDGDDHMSLNGLFGGAYIYDIYYEPDDTTA